MQSIAIPRIVHLTTLATLFQNEPLAPLPQANYLTYDNIYST